MAPPVQPFTTVGIVLALLGPGAVAVLSQRYAGAGQPLTIRAAGLAAFLILVLLVVAVATLGERLRGADVGFGNVSWQTPLLAIVLTAFLILFCGPLAVWMLAKFRLGSFAAGTAALAGLPVWYLIVTIVVVAASEEWLYRGYAIERLTAITGNPWIAGTVSLIAFGLAHIPIWGVGPSLTTLVSGAVFTALYIWRRDIIFLMLAHVATDLYGLLIAPSLASRM